MGIYAFNFFLCLKIFKLKQKKGKSTKSQRQEKKFKV